MPAFALLSLSPAVDTALRAFLGLPESISDADLQRIVDTAPKAAPQP
jgi:hypothetical protein